jgi:hypothetical protein
VYPSIAVQPAVGKKLRRIKCEHQTNFHFDIQSGDTSGNTDNFVDLQTVPSLRVCEAVSNRELGIVVLPTQAPSCQARSFSPDAGMKELRTSEFDAHAQANSARLAILPPINIGACKGSHSRGVVPCWARRHGSGSRRRRIIVLGSRRGDILARSRGWSANAGVVRHRCRCNGCNHRKCQSRKGQTINIHDRPLRCCVSSPVCVQHKVGGGASAY